MAQYTYDPYGKIESVTRPSGITDDVSLIMSSPQAFTDKNLYAYCDNDPINRSDDEGEWWHIAVGAVLGGAFEIASQLVEGNEKINWAAVGVAAGSGALSAATGTWVGTALASGLGSFAVESVKGKSLKESVCSAAISGATAGFIDGHVATKIFGKQAKKVTDQVSIPKGFKNWMKYKAIPKSEAWIKRNKTMCRKR